ncbi:MAG: hypothetical protein B6D41_17130 [Chloroflexi bacterium UTCFX4]|jgi:uncharacterized repeat protein (TIGR03843 family)|nr:MAG: hypothetical protein B6D41_17130 [Chloroflexi bacterium UTCFX4]
MSSESGDKKLFNLAARADADRARMREHLMRGAIELQGMVPWSSNYTYLVSVKYADHEISAIYKPQCGERPLWDFEDGTLCKREVAAYALSAFLGFPNIPVTVLRADAPQGLGMVQEFIEHKRRENFFTLRARQRGAMQAIAVFDALVNNTDRKGGHVLVDAQDIVWAIDHGVTFHQEPKLRTVIWDFIDEPIPSELCAALTALRDALKRGEPIRAELEQLLARAEIRALNARLNALLQTRLYPAPPDGWPHIPWPPV